MADALITFEPHSHTASGWLGHSRVPRTGSPSPVMKTPIVLAPVQERMRNSCSLMTVIDGLIATDASGACEIGSIGKRDAAERSIML